MPRVDINVAELDLFQQMKQNISIRRADQVEDYDPQDSTTYTVLASSVEAVIVPSERPQTILPTGDVIDEPDFQCVLSSPLVDINIGTESSPIITQLEEGDIVIDEDGSTLFVDSNFHPKNTSVMVLGLQRQQ